jgi:hypothetical protein
VNARRVAVGCSALLDVVGEKHSSRGKDKARDHDGDEEYQISVLDNSNETTEPNDVCIVRFSKTAAKDEALNGKPVLHVVVPEQCGVSERIVDGWVPFAKETIQTCPRHVALDQAQENQKKDDRIKASDRVLHCYHGDYI